MSYQQKLAIVLQLCKFYVAMSFTHRYIFGIANADGTIDAYYVIIDNAETLASIVDYDKTTGGYDAIRLNRSKRTKNWIKDNSYKVVRNVGRTDELKSYCKVNNGIAFEHMICERVYKVQRQKHDSNTFMQCGDVVSADGTHYQVKYFHATFTNTQTMHNYS